MSEIYLDNSATTKTHPEVIKEMTLYLAEEYGNPSSLYNRGIVAEKAIRAARKRISDAIHCASEELYFTSGGTEGNNTLIKGIVENKQVDNMRIITTQIEHPSVLEVFKFYESHGMDVVYLPVDRSGRVSLEDIKNSINEKTLLVSIMGVNNETGVVQDLKAIGHLIKECNPKCLFHTDYVQGFMKLPIDVRACKIDALTLCGHKICGPKGIGAIYLKKGVRIKPLIIGGGQESNIRSGTENVPGIMGLCKVVEIQQDWGVEKIQQVKKIRQAMIDYLSARVEEMQVNGHNDGCPYVLSLSFKGVRGEVLLHSLEAKHIYVSTGSACASHKKEKQYVLKAIGLAEEYKEGTIRVSFSMMTTEAEVIEASKAIVEAVNQLRMLLNRKK